MIGELQKRAISADIAAGLRRSEIAAKYGVSVRSISLIRKSLRELPIRPLVAQSGTDIKTEAIGECWTTFRAAVSDHSDIYKAGALARDGLKGLGVFANDNSLQVNTLVQSVPADFRAEMLSNSADDAEFGTR